MTLQILLSHSTEQKTHNQPALIFYVCFSVQKTVQILSVFCPSDILAKCIYSLISRCEYLYINGEFPNIILVFPSVTLQDSFLVPFITDSLTCLTFFCPAGCLTEVSLISLSIIHSKIFQSNNQPFILEDFIKLFFKLLICFPKFSILLITVSSCNFFIFLNF